MPKKKTDRKVICTGGGYELSAMGDESAELLIYGNIGESWWEDSVTAKDVAEQLSQITADVIDVRINSYGGSVSDGIAIYNSLRRQSAAVHVYVDGVAVSIASLIAMAGDTVEMGENALFMVHSPWGAAVGNSKDMRAYADLLDTFARAMASSYENKSGVDHATIMALLTDGEDHWYTAQEALDFGFVDVVNEEEMAAAAGFNKSRFAGSAKSMNKKADIDIGALQIAAQHCQQLINDSPHSAAVVAAISHPPKKEEVTMSTKAKNKATNTDAAEIDDEATKAQAGQDALAKNSQRISGIRNAFAPFKNRDGVAALLDTCVDDHTVSAEQANKKLLAMLGEGIEPIATDLSAGEDESDKFIEGSTQALLARMGAAKHDRSNPYRGMRLSDMASACLERAGVSTKGMTPEEFAPSALSHGIVRGAQTTSDFPVVLENTMHKMVLTGFQAQISTWDRIAKIGDVTDFRAWNRLVPGLIGNLDGVNEQGEYKDKNIPDAQKNSVQATRKGNIISITPEVLVNDDIGYLSDMSTALGRAGSRSIERAFYALIVSNPTLSDGVALFHASHNNLAASGASPTVDLVDAAANAMAMQTAPGDDAEYLDITPDIALVHTNKRGNMTVLIGAEYDPDTANKLQKPNKVKGIVSDIVATPRVGANPWYMFADPSVAPVIEVVFLNGQREPRVVQQENFKTGGLAWRVELPFGVGAIDYRGGYQNPGV